MGAGYGSSSSCQVEIKEIRRIFKLVSEEKPYAKTLGTYRNEKPNFKLELSGWKMTKTKVLGYLNVII